jgi:tRNA (guanosine-2'-O-)-methyltransferase
MSQEAPRRLVRAESVLAGRRRDLTVVLEDAHDPHNLSAVLRTCEAFGIQDVHLAIERSESAPINREVTLGAHRWLTLHRHYGSERTLQRLRQAGYRIHAAILREDAVPLPQVPRDERAAFVFGNEKAGLTDFWIREADSCVAIPSCGFSGSLNLSVAVAVTLYDRLMGTAHQTLPAGNLSEHEKQELRAQWYETLAHGNDELIASYREWLQHPPAPRGVFPVDAHRSSRP